MKTCLFLATLYSLISAFACIVVPIAWICSSTPNSGAWATLMLLVGVPSSIASAGAFNFVRQRYDDVRPTDGADHISETKGTPWEVDPGHTSAK